MTLIYCTKCGLVVKAINTSYESDATKYSKLKPEFVKELMENKTEIIYESYGDSSRHFKYCPICTEVNEFEYVKFEVDWK